MGKSGISLAKLVRNWLIIWIVLLGWWWGTWAAFNLGQIGLGIALGIGLPAAATLVAVIAAIRRSSPEDEDA